MTDMPERDTIKCVLLLEEHISFRQALSCIHECEPTIETVGQAGTLKEARQLIQDTTVDDLDVAVVDLLLPDGSGSEVVRELRERNPDLPVVVLTILDNKAAHVWGESHRVDEVLSKESPINELVRTVKQLATR